MNNFQRGTRSTLYSFIPNCGKNSKFGLSIVAIFPHQSQQMKKQERLLLYVGFAGAALYLLSKARALANLVVSPGNIASLGFYDGVPVAQLSVFAQNTSNAGITINSFAGNVFANGVLVGNVSNFQRTYIPPNSITPVLVELQFKPLGIVSEVISAFANNNAYQEIVIAGFANVAGLQLPVNLSFPVGKKP